MQRFHKQKDRLFELLKQDKKLREDKKEGKSEKLINSEMKYFDEIVKGIETLKNSVDKTNHFGYYPGIWKSTFENILEDINITVEDFKSKSDEWNSNKNITSSDIKANIQDILIRGLRSSGWINQLMIFLSYSLTPIVKDYKGRDMNIKDKMKEHGIDVSLLESICSNVTKMLNELNIDVVVPVVLVDKFDNNIHDYYNCDIRIDKYFTDLSVRDYKGFIFEIESIGYEIKDEEGNIIQTKKPTVYFV